MPVCRIVALACLIALAPLASATTTRVDTKAYVGNNDVLRLTQFDNVCQGGPHAIRALDHAGGVCFQPQAGETSVDVEIVDKSGLPTGGFWSITTLDGTYVSGSFCDAVTLSLPIDTAVVSIVIDGAAQGPFDCNPSGQGSGIGTVGVVKATFS